MHFKVWIGVGVAVLAACIFAVLTSVLVTGSTSTVDIVVILALSVPVLMVSLVNLVKEFLTNRDNIPSAETNPEQENRD